MAPIVQVHAKKIAVIERRLRIELCEIALNLGIVSVGEIIPTTDRLLLKSMSLDGFFLADNPQKRIVEFVNPLTSDFVNLLRARS